MLVSYGVFLEEVRERRTRHHSDLVVHWGLGPHEPFELLADRATAPPLDEGVEDDLVTACAPRSVSKRQRYW